MYVYLKRGQEACDLRDVGHFQRLCRVVLARWRASGRVCGLLMCVNACCICMYVCMYIERTNGIWCAWRGVYSKALPWCSQRSSTLRLLKYGRMRLCSSGLLVRISFMCVTHLYVVRDSFTRSLWLIWLWIVTYSCVCFWDTERWGYGLWVRDICGSWLIHIMYGRIRLRSSGLMVHPYVCDTPRSYVRQIAFFLISQLLVLDSFVCVLYMWFVAHAYVVRVQFECDSSLIRVCHAYADFKTLKMMHSRAWLEWVWHDLFMCATWLCQACSMTHSYV